MRLSLQRHPMHTASVAEGVSATYQWQTEAVLQLRYEIKGALQDLNLPKQVTPQRVDGLWETTCFELFLQESSADQYSEFNFSPSSSWAAYQFSSYRDGMRNLQLPKAPDISLDLSDSHVAIEVTLALPDILRGTPFSASFSAVIAENSGPKSYWALSHPPGKPDFHHKDCFTHQLKAAGSL